MFVFGNFKLKNLFSFAFAPFIIDDDDAVTWDVLRFLSREFLKYFDLFTKIQSNRMKIVVKMYIKFRFEVSVLSCDRKLKKKKIFLAFQLEVAKRKRALAVEFKHRNKKYGWQMIEIKYFFENTYKPLILKNTWACKGKETYHLNCETDWAFKSSAMV